MTGAEGRSLADIDVGGGINVLLGEGGLGRFALDRLAEILGRPLSLKKPILFWDEPETGLHPRSIGPVVEAILALHRTGVQVVLATNCYVVLKEIDLRTQRGDNVRYHSLWRDPGGDIMVSSTDEYAHVIPNPIAEVYADLYDRDVKRALLRAQEKTDAV